jgi:hypothetical protein
MLLLTTIVAALAMQGSATSITDVVVNNVRPSKITIKLTKDVLGPCDVKPLDEQGMIRITGPADERQALVNWISVFDVKPVPVTLAVTVASKIDKVDYRLTLTVANNETFTFTETTTGVQTTFTPRINGDGTITLYSQLALGTNRLKVVDRVKAGQFVILRLDGVGDTRVSSSKLVDPESVGPVVTVSPSLPQ